jgi:CHASE3 domain sensor protein
MSTSASRLRTSLLRSALMSVSSTLVGVLVVVGVLSLFSIWSVNRAWERGIAEMEGLREAARLGTQAQIEFKIQVQEWKNILLRGAEPEELSHYHAAFRGRRERVDGVLTQLSGEAAALALPGHAREIGALQRDFKALCAVYDRALADVLGARDNVPLAEAGQIDRRVRGIDRALEQRLDALSDTLSDLAATRRTALSVEMRSRYDTLRTTLLAVLTAALLIVGLALFGALRKLRD